MPPPALRLPLQRLQATPQPPSHNARARKSACLPPQLFARPPPTHWAWHSGILATSSSNYSICSHWTKRHTHTTIPTGRLGVFHNVDQQGTPTRVPNCFHQRLSTMAFFLAAYSSSLRSPASFSWFNSVRRSVTLGPTLPGGATCVDPNIDPNRPTAFA